MGWENGFVGLIVIVGNMVAVAQVPLTMVYQGRLDAVGVAYAQRAADADRAEGAVQIDLRRRYVDCGARRTYAWQVDTW